MRIPLVRFVTVLLFVVPGRSVAAPAPQVQDSLPPELAASRAALEAGDSQRALELAEKYMWGHPRDPRGFIAVGDVYYTRLPEGLYRAVQAYRRAGRVDKSDPEAFYKLAQVGLAVRGSNGEALVTEGLEKALSIDPLYANAWGQWLTIYRSAGRRDEMLDRLTPHDSLPAVRAMIAQLLIEQERYAEADSVLETVLATDSTNVAWLALRAQCALEAGDAARGLRYYDHALGRAEFDSTGALWKQVVGIATPQELLAWSEEVLPERREDWLRAFWARRNPDLFVGMNDRIAEHFARLRLARREYPWLHPLTNPEHMEAGRPILDLPEQREIDEVLTCEVFTFSSPAASRLGGIAAEMDPGPYDRTRAMIGVNGPQLLRVPFPLSGVGGADTVPSSVVGYNVATGLSDRGLTLLRLGPPDLQMLGGDNPLKPECNTTELVRWRYHRWGELRFHYAWAFGSRTAGEISFQPIFEPQYDATILALTEDHSSVPAPLEFGVWTAQFRDPFRRDLTDVVVVTTQGSLAASLVPDEGGTWSVQQSRSGRVELRADPGSYSLLAHAKLGQELGRQNVSLEVVDH
ncbi:MAG: hypothetical protein PVH40_06250, partial [Gemmatimonadales bacterium]